MTAEVSSEMYVGVVLRQGSLIKRRERENGAQCSRNYQKSNNPTLVSDYFTIYNKKTAQRLEDA